MMISVIIPTKNEENNISELLKRIKKSLKRDFEVIIVDSNSKDNTQELAKETAKKLKIKLKYLNTGKFDLSNSAVYGFKKASGQDIILIDGDLQHPPELIQKMLAISKKENADIVIASRFLKGSKIASFHRRLIARIFRLFIAFFVPSIKVKDPATGFFLFKKDIIKNVDLKPYGFRTLIEILLKARYKKVVEIPLIFQYRKKDKSKVSIKQIIKELSYLFRCWKEKKEYIKFIKFCIIGLIGVIVNQGLLWILTEKSHIYYLISSIIAIEISILSNFVLNDLWTFKNQRIGNFFRRMLKFNIARILTLVINLAALWILTILGLDYLISNLIGIAMATLSAYFLSNSWVWSK